MMNGWELALGMAVIFGGPVALFLGPIVARRRRWFIAATLCGLGLLGWLWFEASIVIEGPDPGAGFAFGLAWLFVSSCAFGGGLVVRGLLEILVKPERAPRPAVSALSFGDEGFD